jgi:hypothetical protein
VKGKIIINNMNCFLEKLCSVLDMVEFELHKVVGRRRKVGLD